MDELQVNTPEPVEVEENPSIFGEQPTSEEGFSVFEDIKPESTVNMPEPVINRNAAIFALGDIEPLATESGDMLNILRERLSLYEERIKSVGDSQIREEKALDRRIDKVRGMVQLSRDAALRDDIETSEGASILAEQAAFEDIEVTAKFAAEEAAAKKLEEIALKDPNQARILKEALEAGSVVESQVDNITKDLMLQSAIDATGAKDRTLLRTSVDVVVDMLNFADAGVSSISLLEDPSFFTKAKNLVFSGKRTEEQAFKFHQMSSKEAAEALPLIMKRAEEASTIFGLRDRGEEAKLLKILRDTPSEFSKNFFDILEIGSVVPVAKVGSVTKSLVSSGARKTAIDVTATISREGSIVPLDQAAKQVGMTAEEVVENRLPKALKHDRDPSVSIAFEAEERLAQNRLMFEELLDLNTSTRITNEEKILAEAKIFEEGSSLKGHSAKDVEIQSEKLADGSTVDKVVSTYGRVDGGGFASKKSAERLLARHALAGEAVKDSSGQWFAKAELPVKEGDFYVAPLKTDLGFFGGAFNPLSKYLKGSSQQGDRFTDGLAQGAGRLADRIHGVTLKLYDANLSKIGKKDSESLRAILIKNTDDKAWMSPEEFNRAWKTKTGKEPHPTIQKGYQDYQKLQDIDYVLRNDLVYKKHALNGLETVNIKMLGQKGNAKVKREIPDSFPERTYNLSDSVHYNSSNLADDATIARLKNEGYIHVTLDQGVKLDDGTIVSSFVGKAKEFEVSPLARMQIGYQAGPHRIGTDKFFAKSASRFTQPDTGKVVLNSPKTYRTFTTESQAKAWTAVMNEARLVSDDLIALEKVFDGRPEFPTPQQFQAEIKKGKIDPKEEFEALFDQTLPSAYNPEFNIARAFKGDVDDPIESLNRSQGKMYYSSRGDRLDGAKDVYGAGQTPVLDPILALHKSLASSSRQAAFSDYQISQANRFMKTFQKYVDPNSVGATPSPYGFVRNAELRPDVLKNKPEIAQEFDVQKRINGRIINAPTLADQQITIANRNIEKILTKAAAGKGDKAEALSVKVSDWQANTNPFNALRGLAFDLKLGLFNPAQFPLQVSTSIQAALLSKTSASSLGGKALELPKVAFQNYSAGVLMRYAYEYGPKSAAVLENKTLLKSLGFSNKKEAEEMFTAFREGGWLDVGNSHILVNDSPTAAVKTGASRGVEKARNNARFFFYEAEKWNRSVAFSVAWREAKLAGKKMSRNDGDTMNFVNRKTNDYSFQMTAESRSAYQKGAASIPTQFFSYPLRMNEMILGKTLSNSQKARLVVGQSALYGSSGTLLVAGADYLKNKTGTIPEAGTPLWMVDRGFIDSLIHFTAGADVSVGQRIGTGNFLPDVVNQLMDNSPYGDVGPLDVLGGAPLQIGGDVMKDFTDVVKYSYATEGKLGDPLTKKAVLDLMKNVSSFSNASKASVAWRYGMLYSNSGTFITEDVTKPEAVFLALGIQPNVMNDIGTAMNHLSQDKELIDDTAKLINKLKTEWVNNPSKRDEINAQINSFKHISKDDVWDKAKTIAERYPNNDSLNESVSKRLREKHSKERMQKRLKDANKKESN